MVVDDDPSMCELLRAVLSQRGYGAATFTNATDAVASYQTDRPAAVILDVVMPGTMDGLAALEAFKKIDHDVAVIVLSGEGRTHTVVRAMKLGAFDFVSKPFDEAGLEAPLFAALRQYHLTLKHENAAPPLSNATAFAAAASEAGNHSLKDISRGAAREAEREVISRMLQRTRWNRKETAEILGISYKALLYKIKENGLDKAP